MIVINDAYGTGLRDNATLAFEAAGGSVVSTPSYNVGDTNFTSQINEMLAEDPDAIVVLAFDETKTIVPALIDAGFSNSGLYFTDGNLADYSADFEAGLIEGSKGTLPGPPSDTISADYKERANALWISNGGEELTHGHTALSLMTQWSSSHLLLWLQGPRTPQKWLPRCLRFLATPAVAPSAPRSLSVQKSSTAAELLTMTVFPVESR